MASLFCVVLPATCVRGGPSQMRAATRPGIIGDLVLGCSLVAAAEEEIDLESACEAML